MTYQISRAIDYRLQWVKNNQDVFNLHPEAATESTNDADQDMEGGRHESESFLSQSFHGSRRHLRSLAINALTIVTELGRPTFFITFTCNVHWPEFDEQLLSGQTPYGI